MEEEKMPKITTVVKMDEARKRCRESGEGGERGETVRRAPFMKVKNERKTGPKSVFLGENFRPGQKSRDKSLEKLQSR